MLHIIKTNSGYGWGDSAMSNTHCLFVRLFIQKMTKFFLEEQSFNSVQAAVEEDGLFVAV